MDITPCLGEIGDEVFRARKNIKVHSQMSTATKSHFFLNLEYQVKLFSYPLLNNLVIRELIWVTQVPRNY